MSLKSSFFELSFDCNRLSDGIVHQEKITVWEKDFRFSLEYLQNLIASELDIPRICQIEISIDSVKLNSCECPSVIRSLLRKLATRAWDKILPISLQYYAACIKFSSLDQLVRRFNVAYRNDNFRVITHVINTIGFDYIFSDGWGSSRATSIRLYLVDVGFMDKIVKFIRHLHEILLSALEGYTSDIPGQLVNRDKKKPCVTLSTLTLAGESLSGSQDFVWNFGANVEDRLYLYKKGILPLLLGTLKIIDCFRNSNESELVNIGNSLATNAFGVFGAFVEIWQIAAELKSERIFLQFMRKSLLQPLLLCGYDTVVSICIFFSLSSHCEISQSYFYENLYNNILHHYSHVHTVGLSGYLAYTTYCVCLSLVNMLNTPGTWNSAQTSDMSASVINIWEYFLSHMHPSDVSSFESEYHFIWGSLEPFVASLFSPKSSYLGFKQRTTDPSSPEFKIVALHFTLVLFSLDVLLTMDSNREQLFKENLFTQLIVADWIHGGIVDVLKYYYPSLTYFPVPSLYDICALTAIRESLGHTAVFYHNNNI